MKFSYHIASPAAIIGGVATAGGAMALLVRDAFVTGWTVDLALMPILVATAILAGHLFWQAVRCGRVLSAAGLALLAILCSGYVVYETTGRRAEVRDVTVAAANDTEKQRQHLLKMLREAEVILAGHRATASAECASGPGKRCAGATYTVSTWESAVTGYETKLAKLPSPKPVDPKAERFAAFVGLFTSAKDADVRKAVAIFEPFALPLILELGSIVFFSYGLSSRRRRNTVAAVAPVEQAAVPVADPPSPPSPKGGSMTKIEAERDLVTLLAMGTAIESQDWLAERWNLGKGTVSRWMHDWEQAGLITRTQYGKQKMIAPA